MNKAYEQVKKFHESCGVEMPDKPTLLSGAGMEINFYYAANLNAVCRQMKLSTNGDEVNKRSSYMLEELVEFMGAETIEDQADALTDMIYFILGTFALMGVRPEAIFDIVHYANMGKVGSDGKVMRNEQGKIQKPEGWQENFAPENGIRAEIERQSKPCKVCNGESKPIYGLECPECE